MRLFSTAESVDRGEISLLAIVETIFATIVAVYLSVVFIGPKWIAWSVCIAPFLLLRTEYSADFGIKILDNYFSWYLIRMLQHPEGESNRSLALDFFRALKSLLVPLLYPFVTAFVGSLIRSIAVPITVCRHPLISFSSIPDNWVRVAFSVDTHCPPEIVPGYEIIGSKKSLKLTAWFLPNLWKTLRHGTLRRRMFVLFFYLPALILFYGPPLFYRWAMKATAIVYTPLLWLAWTTFREIPNLKRLRESDFTRVVVTYSFFVVAGFGLKLILMMEWNNFAAWWNQNPLTHFLAIYVVPAKIPLWQLTALINGIWAIIVFVFVKAAFTRIDEGKPWSPTHVELFLRVSWFSRGVLTLYTVLCTLYLTREAAQTWNFPTVDWRLFPWW
jgi:hypothetical protein